MQKKKGRFTFIKHSQWTVMNMHKSANLIIYGDPAVKNLLILIDF